MKPLKWKSHMARVAELPCCCCGSRPVEVHHLIGRGMKGMGQKSDDAHTIPLCPYHHAELHRIGWRDWERLHGSQLRHNARTLEAVYG